jgi:hypothetical protein
LPGQWLSRISTEKDTKKIIAKKEEHYFYYQSNQKRGARSEEREGCALVFTMLWFPSRSPFSLLAPRFSLLIN